jgi:uroporphyrinogen III methyltransferase/synthase
LLSGKTVLVTRAHDQAASLCHPLEALGAKTIVHPVIRIIPVEDSEHLESVISRISTFDWIVFVSANGVEFFLERFAKTEGWMDSMRQKKIAAIGSSTLSQLYQLAHLKAELTPATANSEGLADALLQVATGHRVLLVRASRGSKVLADRLSRAGIEFEQVAAYQSVDVDAVDPPTADQMRARQIEWVTLTSSAIARSTIRLFGEDLRHAKTVSISPTTSAAMREMGFHPDAEARTYDMRGIVQAIVAHSNRL